MKRPKKTNSLGLVLIRCIVFPLLVLTSTFPIAWCNAGQASSDSAINIHPVAKLAINIPSSSEKSDAQITITRTSKERSLSSPVNLRTSSNLTDGVIIPVTTSTHNTSSGKYNELCLKISSFYNQRHFKYVNLKQLSILSSYQYNFIVDTDTPNISERQRAQKIHCSKQIPECTTLNGSVNATCFGTDLRYNSIYLKGETYWEILGQLKTWEILSFAPKCWQKIQPLLCAYYLPECSIKNKTNNKVSSISMIPKNVCYEAREKCGIIHSLSTNTKSRENRWPEFLDCDNTALFYESQQFLFNEKHNKNIKERDGNISCQTVENLKDTTLERKLIHKHKNLWSLIFNQTKGKCLDPYFLPSNESFYEGIEGCDLNCQSPQFTKEERDFVTNKYFTFISVSLICSMLAFITILIGGAKQAVVPNTSLHHIVLVMQICCILPNIFNLLVPKSFGSENIACREDGKFTLQ